jgi:hypothetical protein
MSGTFNLLRMEGATKLTLLIEASPAPVGLNSLKYASSQIIAEWNGSLDQSVTTIPRAKTVRDMLARPAAMFASPAASQAWHTPCPKQSANRRFTLALAMVSPSAHIVEQAKRSLCAIRVIVKWRRPSG